MAFKKNTAVTGFTVGLVSATDGSDITTTDPVGYYTLDGGTQTAIGDVTPVHEGNGQWSFDLLAAEMNGDIVGLTFTHASAITAHFTIATVTVLNSDLNDIAATDIVSGGAISTTTGAVDSVTLTATTTDITNQVTADMTAISGDTVAADNLESQYDTTGLTGDTFPATQAALGNLATGSSAISVVAESDTVTTGTEVNTYAVTDEVDQVYHEITDVGGVMEVYYQFDVGGNGVASEVSMTGRLQGANDVIGVYAYNWVATAWDQIGSMQGANSTTDGASSFNLLTRHTGTGANIGKIRIRGYAASGLTTATLYIDQAVVSFAVVAQSVGYANGMIWIDTVDGTAGTETYVNGVADNPVDSITDALTLSGPTKANLDDFHVSSASTFAPSVDIQGRNIYGIGYTCTLGGHDYSGTHIFHTSPLTGTATTTGGSDHFDILDSIIGDVNVDDAHFTNCSFNGTVTLSQVSGGDLKIVNSRSIIAGSGTPIIDCGIGALTHSISISNWQNGIEIRNLNNGGTNLFSISGTGQLIVASTCSGTMNVRGQFKITDNSGGSVTFVYDDIRSEVESALADTNELQLNQGNWATATGFATETKQDAQDLIITETRLAELDAANLPTDIATVNTNIGNLNDPTAAAVAAAVATYNMGNGRTIEEALAFLRNKWTIIGGTLTVYDTDDTTVLWTSAMTQTAGNPVSASDPV